MGEAISERRGTAAGTTLAVLLASFVLAYLCLLLPRPPGDVTAIWLPNAVLLAVLTQSRRSRWSTFAVAGLVGQLLANLAAGSPAITSTVLAFCNCAEVLVCAGLMRKFLGSRPVMSRPRTIAVYALIAAGAAAGSGALAALFLSLGSGASGLVNFVTWTVADFTALVTVTPSLVLLAINRKDLPGLVSTRSWPLALLVVTAAATFAQDRYPHPYLVVAALLLTTWRLGMAGAALGVLATLVISVGATVAGHGPFALVGGSLAEGVLALQLFLAVCFYLSVPVAIQNERTHRLRGRLIAALRGARATRAKYRRIADSVRDLIVQTDREGRFLYVSPSCRQLGYSVSELMGQSSFPFIHADDLPRFAAARDRFFQDGGDMPASQWRVRVRTRGGELRWLEGAPNLLRDADGRPVAVETVFRDVTETVAANTALVDSEARYRLLAENLTDMAVIYGEDAIIRFASPAAKSLVGYEPEEMVGRPTTDLLHPDDVPGNATEYRRRRALGPGVEPFRIEYRLVRKDGSVVWVEAHPRAIFDPDTGDFVEWQDVLRDISERKAMEAELRSARAEAEAAARAKADFLANMSHELRTPLTSVLGFAKLAEENVELQGPVRTYVERVRQSSNILLALVNDILDFSKLEAGELTFRPKPVNVSELVRTSLRLFDPQATEKGLLLEVNDTLPADLRLQLDPDRLNQVLLNLISNAVKFTHSGGVWVTPRYDADKRSLSVEVRDTGPDISSEGRQRLFQRFSQVDESDGGRYAGTGLGLAICKGIVEAMGGRIGVTSEQGQGSVFVFTIPAEPVQEPRAGERAGGAGDGQRRVRLLLADDHEDICELVSLILDDLLDVTAVHDGEAAVRLAAEQEFDLMLLDQRMPRLGGPAALRKIRSQPGPNRDTPALAFSAEGDHAGARRVASLGFQGLVPKPFTATELISAIAAAVTALRVRKIDEAEASTGA